MADINSVMGSILSGAGNITQTAFIIIGISLLAFVVLGGLFLFIWMRKRYNLTLEIKKIRSDGKIVLGEIGQGLFNSKRGVLLVKRKKQRAVPIRIIDIKRYLQGEDIVTVIQVGPNDYRPVLADSWTEHVVEYVDEKTNEVIKVKESILNIKIDTAENKAWESAYNVASKKAYSIQSILSQFQTPITIAIVIVAIFLGFAIVWARLPSICG